MMANAAIQQASQGDANSLEHLLLASQVLEVTARKAGNVHPGASFDDCTWLNFVSSAIVSSPVLARSREIGVGLCILEAVRQTRAATQVNTNLGMILLLAPLAAAQREGDSLQIEPVIEALNDDDARALYDAIALANPGGLGQVEQGDVRADDVLPILQAMKLAAERDIIARQYTVGFQDVFALAAELARQLESQPVDDAIVMAHLHQMAASPDTLIARKLGEAVAGESARRAGEVMAAGGYETARGRKAFASLDAWLRADGNRRNPGASADMVAGALFVSLRFEKFKLPARWREEVFA